MRQIQFGFCLPEGPRDSTRRKAYLADLNRALELVTGYFDSAWMVDHLQFGGADLLEGFTTIAYLASLHPQLKFGNAVLCQSFRNPALLAKMGATLQFLSRGRFILGLGAGWRAEEYRAYGYDFPPDHIRVEQLEEALQIIRAMWTEEQASFAGKYYRAQQAICKPKPEPVPIIMLGAFRPKMLRLAAKYADWWNVSSTGPSSYRRMADELDRACAEVDRDPATVRRTWIGGCACASTQDRANALAADRFSAQDEEDFGFVGTPEKVTAQMLAFIDFGVDYFIVDCTGFPDLSTLELLVSEVIPALIE